MKQGKLKQQDLSASDLALAAPKLGQPHGSSIFGKAWGGIENLGGDIATAAKGLPSGFVDDATAIGNDITSALMPGVGPGGMPRKADYGEPGSDIKKKIIDPNVQSYEYTYLGKGAPEGSSLLGRIYEHPLGPILDVASALS